MLLRMQLPQIPLSLPSSPHVIITMKNYGITSLSSPIRASKTTLAEYRPEGSLTIVNMQSWSNQWAVGKRWSYRWHGERSLDEIMDLILFINTTNVRQICYYICPFIKDDKYKTNLMWYLSWINMKQIWFKYKDTFVLWQTHMKQSKYVAEELLHFSIIYELFTNFA